jgi:hypothetical protein
VASTNKGDAPRPAMLTYKGARVLVDLEHMMEDASRAMPAPATAGGSNDVRADTDRRPVPVAQADRQNATRGD